MTNFSNGTAGGLHITGTPLTTDLTAQAAPGLLQNAIDERIVRIRPMSTPIDQLSRCAGSRHCGSMTVEYYSVDTKETASQLTTTVSEATPTDRGNGLYTFDIKVKRPAIFEPSETILFPSVKASPDSNEWLVAYIVDVVDSKLVIAPINAPLDSDGVPVLPDMSNGTAIIRMGRAAAELDVQTAQFQALPKKASNYCQIFKMQVEQSTLQKIADKEANWGFSDQEEAAVIDMRLGMEKNFLFGARAKIFDTRKNQPVYLTGGIWYQAGDHIDVPFNSLNEKQLLSICARAFTGNSGSKSKILIGGTELIEAIGQINFIRAVSADRPIVKWGLKFREIVSNFGTLYVLHSEIFDQCNHAKDGMIIDPDFITKYCHIPFSVEKLDLRSSGQRNTDAVVLTEASCLALRYPAAHFRLIGR